MFDDADDIRGVAATRAFSMVGVNGAVLESCNGLLDETRFVKCVRVDESLDVVFITDGETGIDGCRCSAPVFMEFETTSSSFGLFL